MITAAYLTRRTWRRRKIRILHNHLMTRQLHAIQGTRAALFNNFFSNHVGEQGRLREINCASERSRVVSTTT